MGGGLVAKILQAQGRANGPDLVARIPQAGANIKFHIQRIQIQNGPTVTGTNLFRVYVGTVSPTAQITATDISDTNDADFSVPELVPQGCDIIAVWEGQSAYAGTALFTVITDGGEWV